jgi:hypothetical protein
VVVDSILNVKPFVESPETDLEQRGRLAAGLRAMLADAYVLMVKTRGSGTGQGKIREVFTERVSRTIKGNGGTRNATEDDPRV